MRIIKWSSDVCSSYFVGTDQDLGSDLTNFKIIVEQTHQHTAADSSRTGLVAAVIDPNAGVIAHRALDLFEVLHPRDRQGLQMRALLLIHRPDLTTRAAMDARRGPSGLPMLQKGILILQRFESLTFKGRGLRVYDRMLDRAFGVRIAYPGRVGHDD